MKIKVCGLTQADNIMAIKATGVDMLGFIFHEGSPRDVSKNVELAKWLNSHKEELEGVNRVGVFVNAEVDYILNTIHDYGLTHVQLHGNESAGYCRELQLLWSVSTRYKAGLTKAFRIDEEFDFNSTNDYTGACEWFVFDTKSDQAMGGTGHSWDWSRLQEYQGLTPFLLSGGIEVGDADQIAKLQHPQLWGVDINSGFEQSPGIKDAELVRQFVEAMHR
ncbi:MAG: phosphoribosylanthranilate isomerase [Bacteroidota bacterium]